MADNSQLHLDVNYSQMSYVTTGFIYFPLNVKIETFLFHISKIYPFIKRLFIYFPDIKTELLSQTSLELFLRQFYQSVTNVMISTGNLFWDIIALLPLPHRQVFNVEGVKLIFRIPSFHYPLPPCHQTLSIIDLPIECQDPTIFSFQYLLNNSDSSTLKYDKLVIGGTFDHLHNGHKLFLSVASLCCKKQFWIGLANDVLLSKKKYVQYLESFDTRSQHLTNFIHYINPQISIHIEHLIDIYGPSVSVKDLDAILVSKETVEGANKVNIKRNEEKSSILAIIVVDLVGNEITNSINDKMSSTKMRQFLHLRKQWYKLCSHFCNSSQYIERWWMVMVSHYQEKHRFYHTLSHIEHFLSLIHRHVSFLYHPLLLEIACWFHDIIYNTNKIQCNGEKSNEELSADLFLTFTEDNQVSLDNASIKEIYNLIISTKYNYTSDMEYSSSFSPFPSSPSPSLETDVLYFVDFDCSILGAETQIYQKYSQNIRQEYSHIPLSNYIKNRINALKKLSSCFSTPLCQELFNCQSKENISNEIESLRKELTKLSIVSPTNS